MEVNMNFLCFIFFIVAFMLDGVWSIVESYSNSLNGVSYQPHRQLPQTDYRLNQNEYIFESYGSKGESRSPQSIYDAEATNEVYNRDNYPRAVHLYEEPQTPDRYRTFKELLEEYDDGTYGASANKNTYAIPQSQRTSRNYRQDADLTHKLRSNKVDSYSKRVHGYAKTSTHRDKIANNQNDYKSEFGYSKRNPWSFHLIEPTGYGTDVYTSKQPNKALGYTSDYKDRESRVLFTGVSGVKSAYAKEAGVSRVKSAYAREDLPSYQTYDTRALTQKEYEPQSYRYRENPHESYPVAYKKGRNVEPAINTKAVEDSYSDTNSLRQYFEQFSKTGPTRYRETKSQQVRKMPEIYYDSGYDNVIRKVDEPPMDDSLKYIISYKPKPSSSPRIKYVTDNTMGLSNHKKSSYKQGPSGGSTAVYAGKNSVSVQTKTQEKEEEYGPRYRNPYAYDPCKRLPEGDYILQAEFKLLFPLATPLCSFVKCANYRGYLNPCSTGTQNLPNGKGFCTKLDLLGDCGYSMNSGAAVSKV